MWDLVMQLGEGKKIPDLNKTIEWRQYGRYEISKKSSIAEAYVEGS